MCPTGKQNWTVQTPVARGESCTTDAGAAISPLPVPPESRAFLQVAGTSQGQHVGTRDWPCSRPATWPTISRANSSSHQSNPEKVTQ